jgi:hypothetical protein
MLLRQRRLRFECQRHDSAVPEKRLELCGRLPAMNRGGHAVVNARFVRLRVRRRGSGAVAWASRRRAP